MLPDTGAGPLLAPLTVQLLALVEDQRKVDDCPRMIVEGVADTLTVVEGALEFTVTVAEREVLPPGPVQMSV